MRNAGQTPIIFSDTAREQQRHSTLLIAVVLCLLACVWLASWLALMQREEVEQAVIETRLSERARMQREIQASAMDGYRQGFAAGRLQTLRGCGSSSKEI